MYDCTVSPLKPAVTMDRSLWVKEQLVPTMVAHGSFGNNSKGHVAVSKCHVTSQETGDDHFTSDTFFVSLELKFRDGPPEEHALLVKLSPEDATLRQVMETDVLFPNEALMYTEAIPAMEDFLQKRGNRSVKSLFPRCYYAGDDVVVLQDMRPQGFSTAAERVTLDYDHCALALRSLGRFHAVSYGMKKLDEASFRSMATQFGLQGFVRSPTSDNTYFLKRTASRPFQYLEDRHDLDVDVLERLKSRLEDAGQVFVDLVKPKEPLAVLCHGDFCRNNMLFRYEAGKPCEVKFFDLQTVKYSSPVIDISFFLYLNTSAELREGHWDGLLQEYHSSLISSLSEILGCPARELMPEYGLRQLHEEFAELGLYGFMVCSFFLPEMMVDPSEQVSRDAIVSGKSVEELADMNVEVGGDVATERVAAILKHLASKGGL